MQGRLAPIASISTDRLTCTYYTETRTPVGTMRFGKTLQQSVYSPWKAQYMDYAKLKNLLREDRKDDDQAWTEEDENQFCDEIFNVQLDKVAKFQEQELGALKDRIEVAFDKLKETAPTDDKPKSDITNSRLKELKTDLDAITNEVKELKKYSSANYTGFLKIVKKHDRKRGDRYKVRPLMRLTLSNRGLNSESAYTPLLKKLSTMYYIIDSHLEEGEQLQLPDLEHQEVVYNGEKYTAHKCRIILPKFLPEYLTADLCISSLDSPRQPARSKGPYWASSSCPRL